MCTRRGCFFFTQQFEDAAREFQSVVEKEPGHASAHEGLGDALFRMRKYDEAEKILQKASSSTPGSGRQKTFSGTSTTNTIDMTRHRRCTPEAILLNPREILLYNNLGVSLSLAGHYESAIKAYRHALEKGGPKGKVYNNLAWSLQRPADTVPHWRLSKRDGQCEGKQQPRVRVYDKRGIKGGDAMLQESDRSQPEILCQGQRESEKARTERIHLLSTFSIIYLEENL